MKQKKVIIDLFLRLVVAADEILKNIAFDNNCFTRESFQKI